MILCLYFYFSSLFCFISHGGGSMAPSLLLCQFQPSTVPKLNRAISVGMPSNTVAGEWNWVPHGSTWNKTRPPAQPIPRPPPDLAQTEILHNGKRQRSRIVGTNIALTA